MSARMAIREVDRYHYHAARIEELNRHIRIHAKLGHGHRKFHDHTRRVYRNGSNRPRGIHDYYSLAWDPRIIRGKTFQDFREKNIPATSTTENFAQYCTDSCSAPKLPLKPLRRSVGRPRLKVGGVFRPTTDDIVFEDSAGQKRHKQDDSRREMEPYIVEQLQPPLYLERGTQADEIKAPPRRKCHPVHTGTSQTSQANICIASTGHKEDPIRTLFQDMGSKILEQSVLETYEELELQSVRRELRGYQEARRNRQARTLKLLAAEVYKAEIEEMEMDRASHQREREREADILIGSRMFAINAVRNVVSTTFDDLRISKYLHDEFHDTSKFLPWVTREMYRIVQVPRKIVDDIITTVERKKLEEVFLASLANRRTEEEEMKVLEIVEEDEEDNSTDKILPRVSE